MTARSPLPAAGRIVTANRLIDGAVVYLAADGVWSRRIEDAAVVADEAAETRLLTEAEAHVRARRVVGPYVMPLAEAAGGFKPMSVRERIRAVGPTVQQALWSRRRRAANGRDRRAG